MSARQPLQLADLTKSQATPTPDVEELVYLSARVPKSLRTELQHAATDQGRPLAQLVQDAVRAYLESLS